MSTWRPPARRAASALGAAAGILADGVLGEPPASLHPLVGFGRVIRGLEARIYADARGPGVAHAAAGSAIGLGAGVALGAAVRSVRGGAAGCAAAAGVATYVAVGGRALREAAVAVASALDAGDLDGARRLLPALAGRDPSALDAKEIARAVVESLAENTVDAVVAPALWGAVAGAPGALWYRGVNTLDAMVGHHDERYERYGWASARLDDVANGVPARVAAALVMVVRPARANDVWRTVRAHAVLHPSPNAGVIEAAFAAALGLRLGGANTYGDRVEGRAHLGDGRPAEPGDIAAAARLSLDVARALAAALTLVGAIQTLTDRLAGRAIG